jgi:hypothetical protein
MRAIEKPVAGFCIRAGMRFSYVLEPWIERPQYSCNLPSVSRTCVLTVEKPSKKFAPEWNFRRKQNRIGAKGMIKG